MTLTKLMIASTALVTAGVLVFGTISGLQSGSAAKAQAPQQAKSSAARENSAMAPTGRIWSGNEQAQAIASGPSATIPTEKLKATTKPYIIEPPDILRVEALCSLPDRPLNGERLVQTDGTIGLGTYGNVRVAGLTVPQAQKAIEEQLSEFIKAPRVNVELFANNSKFMYVIADGGVNGDQAIRLPCTGNETVLDAISQIGGLPPIATKKTIFLARPSSPREPGMLLPIDWIAITQKGDTMTNYQLFPGDRIYLGAPLQASGGIPVERASSTKSNQPVKIRARGFEAEADSMEVLTAKDMNRFLLKGNVHIRGDRDGVHLELKLDQVEIGQAGDRMEIKAVKVNGGV